MSFFSWCQIVRFIMLVPNCPGAKLSGAKLSVFIMLVPNCPGAKLSGAKLSWCQIVLVPNCPVPNCPTTVSVCPVGHRNEGKIHFAGLSKSVWQIKRLQHFLLTILMNFDIVRYACSIVSRLVLHLHLWWCFFFEII